MNNHINLSHILLQIVAGDLTHFDQLFHISGDDLVKARNQIKDLTLTNKAILRVLSEFQNAILTEEQVQQWASFIRWGYIGMNQNSGPIRPIDIEFQEEFEEPIIEALSRLDELGDIVDGEIGQDELNQLISSLQGNSV